MIKEKKDLERMKYLDKRVSMRKEEFYYTKPHDTKLIQEFTKLTRLQFNNVLPKICELCGALDDLQIHHLRYVYPIVENDLIRLCRKCHLLEHQRIDNIYFYDRKKRYIERHPIIMRTHTG